MTASAEAPRPLDTFTEIGTGGEHLTGADLPPIAVIAFHGMGQQVPFETLDLVARGLRDADTARRETLGLPPPGKIRVEYARLEADQAPPAPGATKADAGPAAPAEAPPRGPTLPRAVVRIAAAKATRERPQYREVHLYEAYWAPLTEGKTTAWNVVWFLATAGWNGIRYGLSGQWARWMFDGIRPRPIPHGVVLPFILAFLVVGALVITNSVTAAVAAARLVIGPAGAWPSGALLRDLTLDMWLFMAGVVAFWLGASRISSWLRSRSAWSYRNPWRLHPVWAALCWPLVWIGLLATVVAAAFLGGHLLWHREAVTDTTWGQWAQGVVRTAPLVDPVVGALRWLLGVPLLVFSTWVGVFVSSWFVRRLLVQYLGDVALYVSAHSVSEAWLVRKAIKDASAAVARAVYGASTDRRAGPPERMYAQVVLLGHSLGSIVAYDTLNLLINEDLTGAQGPRPLDVVQRTPLLLTFGSPLDKTAFVFTAQQGRAAQVREALAAATQPLIVDWDYRPARWVNISSPADWIGGSLDFYDPAGTDGNAKRVRNLVDDYATTPVSAHNEYWFNPLFIDTLYEAVS